MSLRLDAKGLTAIKVAPARSQQALEAGFITLSRFAKATRTTLPTASLSSEKCEQDLKRIRDKLLFPGNPAAPSSVPESTISLPAQDWQEPPYNWVCTCPVDGLDAANFVTQAGVFDDLPGQHESYPDPSGAFDTNFGDQSFDFTQFLMNPTFASEPAIQQDVLQDWNVLFPTT
jgi:hypothetical protein